MAINWKDAWTRAVANSVDYPTFAEKKAFY